MAWLEGDARNIASGWGPEPKLEAPNIGATLSAILTNRRVQQQQTQEALTAAIKAQQDRNSSAAYIQAAQNAGVLPQGDYSGMTEKAASDLAQRIQDQTPDTDVDELHQAMTKYYSAKADEPYAPNRGGVPRVWRQMPTGEWGAFTPAEAYKIDQDAQNKEDYGKLSSAEAKIAAQTTAYEKKYGVDTDSGGLKAPGWGADQATKDQYAKDQVNYAQLSGTAAMIRKNRENFEKWHRIIPQQDSGQPDTEDTGDTSLPPVTSTPPPAQPQSTPAMPPGVTYVPGPSGPQGGASPAPTPRPGVQLAPGYGTPAPGAGSGQVGNLVPGQSRRFVGGKWWVWDGNQWQPE